MVLTKNDINIIIYPKKISGILFYCFEYYIYLLESGLDINIFIILDNKNINLKKTIAKLIIEKYSKKYADILIKKIIYIKSRIYSKNILIFDYYTFSLLNSKILYKKCFYNYTNNIESLVKTFKEYSNLKNIIPFGNTFFSKVKYNFPLLINFKMFKSKLNIRSNVYIENKNKIKINRRIIKNFHESFDTVLIFRTDFDRANRLIPESKFYNKKILIFNIQDNQNNSDSIDYLIKLYSKNHKYPDLYKSGFNKFIKDNI